MTSQVSPLLVAAAQALTDADLPAVVAEPTDPSDPGDGWLRVTTPTGVTQYRAEVKHRISRNSAGAVNGGEGRLVVTEYIAEPAAEVLRKRDVQYVDAVGNMYLRGPGLFVDVRGRRRQEDVDLPKYPPQRAFRASGVRVIFTLLCDPETVSAPYRAIAERSTASLGTVQQVLTDLEAAGFIYHDGGRRLQRLGDLLDRWAEAYILNLWPKLPLARFESTEPTWWRMADSALRSDNAQWSGETAAQRLRTRLSPEHAIIYADTIPRNVVLQGRLRKARDGGDVEIRRRFWNFGDDDQPITVPTPLVYADLLASADPRQREAATHLREHDDLLRRLVNH